MTPINILATYLLVLIIGGWLAGFVNGFISIIIALCERDHKESSGLIPTNQLGADEFVKRYQTKIPWEKEYE